MNSASVTDVLSTRRVRGTLNWNASWVPIGIFVIACAVRLNPLVWPTIVFPDEVFQALEQGHRVVFGYGLVPWEFEYGARSWLLGYFCAAIMSASRLIGDGPDVYVPMITAVLAALSAASATTAYFWARRHFTTSEAILAALVPVLWVDNWFFGPHALSESVAGSLLLIGLFLSVPRDSSRQPGRLILAGFILAACAFIRIQLVPAIVLISFWAPRTQIARRLSFLALGALAAICLDGWFDAMTWGYPFEPAITNFRLNIFTHVASSFGVAPWWFYLMTMFGFWSGLAPIFIVLAICGAKREPLPFCAAIVLILVHTFVAHKEYRFLAPAILLLSVNAGFGLVELKRLLQRGLGTEGQREAPQVYATVMLVSVLALIATGVAPNYWIHWNRDSGHDVLLAWKSLSHETRICGIGLYGMDEWRTGGYAYLHRRIPIYAAKDVSLWTKGVGEQSSSYNELLYRRLKPEQNLQSPESSGFTLDRCFGEVCLLHRAGGCKPAPMRAFDPPPGLPKSPPYPQPNGVVATLR